jgi:predicted transcriptional regulator
MDWLKSAFSPQRSLGPLESALLRSLWQRGNGTVRELIDEQHVEGAYTTVMTTLDRLYKKGLLDRAAEGRAYRYRPRQTEEEFNRTNVAAGLEELFRSVRGGQAPLSFLVDEITKHDAELLDELQRAIEAKRRELKKRGAQ